MSATTLPVASAVPAPTLSGPSVRPLLQGLVLRLMVGSSSLAAIYFHVISI